MPTYDYRCSNCNHTVEIIQKITEESKTFCEKCQTNTLARLPSGGIGLSFNGDGFYATMYNKSSEKRSSDLSSPSKPECCPCGKNASRCSN